MLTGASSCRRPPHQPSPAMRSSALACLLVLSLGLSAAPAALAGDAGMGGMGSMLAAYSRGLLSVDASKKVPALHPACAPFQPAHGFCAAGFRT